MKAVTVETLKRQMGVVIKRVLAGEEIWVTHYGVPVLKLVPIKTTVASLALSPAPELEPPPAVRKKLAPAFEATFDARANALAVETGIHINYVRAYLSGNRTAIEGLTSEELGALERVAGPIGPLIPGVPLTPKAAPPKPRDPPLTQLVPGSGKVPR